MAPDGSDSDPFGGSESNSAEGRRAALRRRRGTGRRGGARALGLKIGVVVAAVFGVSASVAMMLPSAVAPETPESVLRRYVQATLADHDPTTAATLTCRTPQLDAIGEWERDLAAREQQYALPPLHVDLTAYADARTGRRITASTEVAVSLMVDDRPQQRLTRPFSFVLVQQHGWKVCGAAQAD